MNKYLYKFYTFMKDRNGIDDLYRFCFAIFIIVSIINLFINNSILIIIELLLLIILFYRFFSKDLVKRRRENNYYVKKRKNIRDKIDLIKKRWRDRDSYIYRKCPKCKRVLRLPVKKGVNMCKCPKCDNRFKVRCFRKERIRVEVIKNK